MPQRKGEKSKSGSKGSRPWKPRRRGDPNTPPTIAKSYTLPLSAFLAIRKVASEYGSQGRAVQVGSEILSRLKAPVPVKGSGTASHIRMTYKLVPRTIELIERLKETAYENSGQVFTACVQALKLKGLDLRLRKKRSPRK